MRTLITGGYALTTKRDCDIACKVAQTNLTNRWQALYSALELSDKHKDLTVYGYEQTTGNHRLVFIVKNGIEVPMFEVQA